MINHAAKMIRRFLLIFLTTASPLLVFGSQTKIDSLSKLLEQTTDDSTKCELYISIALLAYSGEFAVSSGHKALHLAKMLKNERLKGKAYNSLAWCYDLRVNQY